jgi:hypothetical protein
MVAPQSLSKMLHRIESSHLFLSTQTKHHHESGNFPFISSTHLPFLFYFSHLQFVNLLISMGCSARGLTSVSHMFTFGMELECFRKTEVCSFSSQLCHGKWSPFYKPTGPKRVLAEQNASQSLSSRPYNLIDMIRSTC